VRLFGAFGRDGGALEAWARRALLAQPEDFFKIAWIYLRSYYVPGLLPARISATSTGLDPQLDFTNTNRGEAIVVAAIKQDLETFYDRFTVQPLRSGVRFLHDWQGVIKFGAPALSITTVLTLIGLAIGPRRSRVGVLLSGVGGLSLQLAPCSPAPTQGDTRSRCRPADGCDPRSPRSGARSPRAGADDPLARRRLDRSRLLDPGGLVERDLAQPDRRRRHLHALVGAQELERLVE